MKRNTLYIIASFTVVASLLGWGIYTRLKKEGASSEENKPTEELQSKAVVKVSVITAKKQDLIMYINTACTAKAEKEVEIVARAAGTAADLRITENSPVKAGELLFTIKNEAYKLELENAENELLNAKIEYGIKKKQSGESTPATGNISRYATALNQLQEDLKSGRITRDDFDNKKLEIEVEELLDQSAPSREKMLKHASGLSARLIAYKQALLNYEYTQVKAPFAGYAANLKITNEANIVNGQSCLQLVDLSRIRLDIPVLESEVGELKEGRQVKVKFNAYPGREFKGTIKNISPVIDGQTRTCNVIAYVENNDHAVKPGMTGTATIEGIIYPNRLIVPKEAVIVRDSRKLIFIAENGKAKWLYVKTGLENFDYVEILDQLQEGQKVITTNNYTLAHDADIKISE